MCVRACYFLFHFQELTVLHAYDYFKLGSSTPSLGSCTVQFEPVCHLSEQKKPSRFSAPRAALVVDVVSLVWLLLLVILFFCVCVFHGSFCDRQNSRLICKYISATGLVIFMVVLLSESFTFSYKSR